MIYSPRATHEGNKSRNHELKADKWLIFTLARIPQGMQKYTEENSSIIVILNIVNILRFVGGIIEGII